MKLADPSTDREYDYSEDNYHMDRSLEEDRKYVTASPIHDMSDTGTGEMLLQDALSKAEFKFEDKQTTKLVKDEYDVVDEQAEDDNPSTSESVDDDFEMI